MKELFNKDQPIINLKGKMNTRFDNPVVADANSSCLEGKDSYRKKDKFDRILHGRYDKYPPLNASWENIYQECANTEF